MLIQVLTGEMVLGSDSSCSLNLTGLVYTFVGTTPTGNYRLEPSACTFVLSSGGGLTLNYADGTVDTGSVGSSRLIMTRAGVVWVFRK